MVIDESPDIILLKDWDGRFLLGNRALATLYGTTPELLEGRDDGAFNPNAEQVAFSLENVREVIRGGVTQIVQETSTDVETGETRYFHSIKEPVVGPGGEPRILVIAHDVTDLQRAHQAIEERERSYSYAMAAAGEGIWDWDLTTNQVTHNAKWSELLGFEDVELEHPVDVFAGLLHEDDRDEVAVALDAAMGAGGEYHHVHRMRRRDGRVIWVLDRGRVVEWDGDGRPARMAGSITDITELVRADRVKSEFVSSVSHELRSPLTSIRGALGLLVDGAAGELPERAQALVEIAHQNSLRLSALIDDLLDVESLTSGEVRMDRQVQELLPLVRQAIEDNREHARPYGVSIDLDDRTSGVRVEVDGQRLVQVLTNLLSNAAKYSPRGGTGLGLAIAKELLDRMHGSIGYQPGPHGGSVFWFTLPIVGRG